MVRTKPSLQCRLEALRLAIDRFNAAHPWSHNDFYHRWLLRQLPARLPRTIDVGCGIGNLVLAISQRADVSEGIDADPAVIAAACACAGPAGCSVRGSRPDGYAP